MCAEKNMGELLWLLSVHLRANDSAGRTLLKRELPAGDGHATTLQTLLDWLGKR